MTPRNGSTSWPRAWAWIARRRSGGSTASSHRWCGPLGWRPRLILPRELWKSLDDHQRATLIIHELAHLRRGDHHLRFFELLVTALYWWHPVLWWARRALRDVEEQCCDAWVVWALPDAAKSYAETLLETLDFLNQSRPRRAAVGQRLRQGPSSPKEVNHDYEWNDAPPAGYLGHAGLIGAGGRAPARQCHLGPEARGKEGSSYRHQDRRRCAGLGGFRHRGRGCRP